MNAYVPVIILVISVPVAAFVGAVAGWFLRDRIGRNAVEDAANTGEFRLGSQFYRVVPSAPRPKRKKRVTKAR